MKKIITVSVCSSCNHNLHGGNVEHPHCTCEIMHPNMQDLLCVLFYSQCCQCVGGFEKKRGSVSNYSMVQKARMPHTRLS